MNNKETKETKFDEVDAIIASALADESSWPVPDAGFEERCERRVMEIVSEKKERRSFWAFGRAQWMKIAAILLVALGFAVFLVPGRDGSSIAGVGSADGVLVAHGCDDLYEEVEEFCEIPEEDLGRQERLANAAKRSLPKSPTAKVLKSLCVAVATKLSGV